jgi:hypothetical protein
MSTIAVIEILRAGNLALQGEARTHLLRRIANKFAAKEERARQVPVRAL